MEWDYERKAYFPKNNTDLIAQYQANYGFNADQEGVHELTDEEKTAQIGDYWRHYYNVSSQEQPALPELDDNEISIDCFDQTEVQQRSIKRKSNTVAAQHSSDWHDVNTDSIRQAYVTGLPHDITKEEFKKFMSKCGVIQSDIITSKPKLKLYRDNEGRLKGDGICTYVRPESVTLAVQMLDGVDVRGYKVCVERARFEPKGEFDPMRKRKKLNNRIKHKYRDTHQM
uniref:RRM domain-containing protein n=1 Tax=Arion vulgaris TaxID=1028688 RepID=A0A0B7BP01_9EUPU